MHTLQRPRIAIRIAQLTPHRRPRRVNPDGLEVLDGRGQPRTHRRVDRAERVHHIGQISPVPVVICSAQEQPRSVRRAVGQSVSECGPRRVERLTVAREVGADLVASRWKMVHEDARSVRPLPSEPILWRR